MNNIWQLAAIGLCFAQLAVASPVRVIQIEKEWEKPVEKVTFGYANGNIKSSIDVKGTLFISHFEETNDYYTTLEEAARVVREAHCGKKFSGRLMLRPKDPNTEVPFGPRNFPIEENYEVNAPLSIDISHLKKGAFSLQHTRIDCR